VFRIPTDSIDSFAVFNDIGPPLLKASKNGLAELLATYLVKVSAKQYVWVFNIGKDCGECVINLIDLTGLSPWINIGVNYIEALGVGEYFEHN
jgi:hypothetical protein